MHFINFDLLKWNLSEKFSQWWQSKHTRIVEPTIHNYHDVFKEIGHDK